MRSFYQSPISAVYSAGRVRGAEFAVALLKELGRRVPDKQVVRELQLKIINLRIGLQESALESKPARRDLLLGYVQETYGLNPAGLDPLLRPLLPPISAAGSSLVRVILSVNGFNLLVNGKYILRGYVLVPNDSVPVYTKPLGPGESFGAYTFNGMAGSVLSFNPTTGAAAAPFTAFLWVGGEQVGRVDYPPVAAGTGFSLLYNDELYYGSFPATTNQTVEL